MDKKEVFDKIGIVVDKEFNECRNKRPTWKLQKDDKNKSTLIYSNSDVLIGIFSNIQNNEEAKKNFVTSLKVIIANDSSDVRQEYDGHFGYNYIPYGSAQICFYTLIRLGYVDDALEGLLRRSRDSSLMINFLFELFNEDYIYFNNDQLGRLLNNIKLLTVHSYYSEIKKAIITKLINQRFELLKNELKSVNIEINQDKKELVKKFEYLEFDGKYNELLIDIDKYIYGDTPKIVNSGMIGNLRAFLENLVKDIAIRMSQKFKEQIPHLEDRSEMGDKRGYIKQKFGLSDSENKFINNFIDILHAEGGHDFVSEKEYFRLARNIAIEISLFLLSKYEKTIK
ncbi:hypothetical protein HYY70_06805 [Candidatus Woesearchaeota archaeon]|nr:hypothetical protein [Candidatus Woesearchaeota archaeon]